MSAEMGTGELRASVGLSIYHIHPDYHSPLSSWMQRSSASAWWIGGCGIRGYGDRELCTCLLIRYLSYVRTGAALGLVKSIDSMYLYSVQYLEM